MVEWCPSPISSAHTGCTCRPSSRTCFRRHKPHSSWLHRIGPTHLPPSSSIDRTSHWTRRTAGRRRSSLAGRSTCIGPTPGRCLRRCWGCTGRTPRPGPRTRCQARSPSTIRSRRTARSSPPASDTEAGPPEVAGDALEVVLALRSVARPGALAPLADLGVRVRAGHALTVPVVLLLALVAGLTGQRPAVASALAPRLDLALEALAVPVVGHDALEAVGALLLLVDPLALPPLAHDRRKAPGRHSSSCEGERERHLRRRAS